MRLRPFALYLVPPFVRDFRTVSTFVGLSLTVAVALALKLSLSLSHYRTLSSHHQTYYTQSSTFPSNSQPNPFPT
ncbi:hypothetical protein F4810DRAFT_460633 [Camillea tinctor]|nr:hypothetical protein F4810DRAFT_460633 [Camillea tinctor]